MNQLLSDAERDRVWLVSILLIGLTWRAAAIFGFNHAPESDELAYHSMAVNLLSGHGILENGNRAFYNVGYPLFILTPIYYLFGPDLFHARIANSFLGLISITLCYFVAKEAGAGKFGSRIAAAIWAVYLPTGIYGVYLAKENLMVPLLLGVMWCILRLAQKPSVAVVLACGVLFGFLALTGNAALVLIAVAAIALIFPPIPLTERLFAFGGVLALAFLVSLPWMIRNQLVIGAPVLNTNGGFNLYLGNNPAATGYFVSIADTPRASTWHQLRTVSGELGATQILKQEAVSWIREHPGKFTVLAIKKAAYFWKPPFHSGKGGNTSFMESITRLAWAFQFILIISAAATGLSIERLKKRELLLLWLAVACYTSVHMLFYVIFRYREPIMPIVGVLAAISVESYWLKKGTQK